MARDHRQTLADRNRLARERGFKNYYEQRRATEFANKQELFTDATEGGVYRIEGESRAEYNERVRNARTFYDAFKRNPDDYSVDGPKAKWFVEVVGLMTIEEWRKHYPNGVREYTKLISTAA